MDAITTVLVAMVLFMLVVVLLVTWGLVRATRSAQRHARRTRARIAEALPATTFGRRLWWLNCRVTRVEEIARESVEVSAGSVLAAEVARLAADLNSGVTTVRVRLRTAGRLTGRLRQEEVTRIDVMIGELESGVEALVDLAERALAANPRKTTDAVEVARHVRHRANMYKLALDELDGDATSPPSLEAAADPGWVPPRMGHGAALVDPDDADTGARLVPRVQGDEERGESLDR